MLSIKTDPGNSEYLGLFHISVTRSHVPLSSGNAEQGPRFLLPAFCHEWTYWNLSCCLSHSLQLTEGFSSSWALAFLTPSREAWAVFLYSSWLVCPSFCLCILPFSRLRSVRCLFPGHPHRPSTTLAQLDAHRNGCFCALRRLFFAIQPYNVLWGETGHKVREIGR